MILDEKVLMYPPPPPYVTSAGPPPFPSPRSGPRQTLTSLPAHILLQIVYMSFPQTHGVDEGRVERQRKTLLWLANGLRLVNRAFYIACMHVLRSTYLPAYQSLIRPPYTSDPFPSSPSLSSVPSSSPSIPSYTPTPQDLSPLLSPLQTIQRETPILDRFILLKVREDVFVDESELHLEREDMFKDLFDLSQPKARLEDLVRVYGVREGVVTLGLSGGNGGGSGQSSPVQSKNSSAVNLASYTPSRHSPVPPSPSSPSVTSRASAFFSSLRSSSSKSPSSYSSSSSTPTPFVTTSAPQRITPLPFHTLSITFSPRSVGIVQNVGTGRKRTIVQVGRVREEKLEVAAKRVVKELRAWLEEGLAV
ncbi:hypothetical protein BDQ12DRAFT_684790 [Crucibulum laeve]|uniref:Uncharacterized protein n=1 Tax=Crucibulum laeve TaxID=68775 RepID=A0A5C3LZH8_9AGAR|nr:hypothetical protein BDQ12DRAFT_684790 [Crucibulum laeve]